MSSGTRAFVHQ